MIKTSVFGTTKEGKEVLAFTISEGRKRVTILNYGGIVQSLVLPAKDGRLTDVICGYKTVKEYEENGGYLGALIGRFGNRIGEGKLTVDGTEYQLYNNDRGNHLHGGKNGFNKKIWAHGICGNTLALSIISPDGEENYPGTLKVTVVYTFRNGVLRIHYRAVSDKKTVINLTNHAYFNLNGESSNMNILNNVLTIDSDYITPTNNTLIPLGGFKAVEGTPFDFKTPKEIGRDIRSDDEDMRRGGGYDHCYVLRSGVGNFAKYAEAYSPVTGIKMQCYTNMPAVQLYTGNGMNQQGRYTHYGANAGFCLETQAIPNNVNVEEYAAKGSSYYDAGEKYDFAAEYRFTVE